jgi:hypothetical protein
MVDQVAKAAKGAAISDPADRLRNAIRAQFEFHDANREFFEVLMRHHKGPPSAGTTDWKLIGQPLKRHHAILADLIARLQRQKIILKGDNIDFATALLGMVIHLTRGAMKDGKQPLAATNGFCVATVYDRSAVCLTIIYEANIQLEVHRPVDSCRRFVRRGRLRETFVGNHSGNRRRQARQPHAENHGHGLVERREKRGCRKPDFRDDFETVRGF